LQSLECGEWKGRICSKAYHVETSQRSCQEIQPEKQPRPASTFFTVPHCSDDSANITTTSASTSTSVQRQPASVHFIHIDSNKYTRYTPQHHISIHTIMRNSFTKFVKNVVKFRTDLTRTSTDENLSPETHGEPELLPNTTTASAGRRCGSITHPHPGELLQEDRFPLSTGACFSYGAQVLPIIVPHNQGQSR
jgi:hypothetical protein